MQCPRCHNNQAEYLYEINGRYYCRKCISFHRVFIDENRKTLTCVYPRKQVKYHLDFDLSLQQMKISNTLVKNYQQHKDSLVLAVCGSGKTEIVYGVIAYALSLGHRVCFCVPRQELVKELEERIVHAFNDISIGVFFGGRHDDENAQLILCTMHQLYRFENHVGFQLMIADEIDAFPFYQNDVLNALFDECCVGHYVKMSATLSEKDVKHEELLVMNRRYHGHDLPLPISLICFSFLQKFVVLGLVKTMHKKVIIYVPTIAILYEMVRFLHCFHIQTLGVSSLHPHNRESIKALKDGKVQCLVSTTLLERGITIEDVQVIVYQGQHPLFDEKTLIQIAGRVGRKPLHPTGKVYILTTMRTKAISQCIKTIKRLNM